MNELVLAKEGGYMNDLVQRARECNYQIALILAAKRRTSGQLELTQELLSTTIRRHINFLTPIPKKALQLDYILSQTE